MISEEKDTDLQSVWTGDAQGMRRKQWDRVVAILDADGVPNQEVKRAAELLVACFRRAKAVAAYVCVRVLQCCPHARCGQRRSLVSSD